MLVSGPSLFADEPAKGHLIAIGGGKLPDRILKRFIELAGGPSARLLVIPQASENPDAGSKGMALFAKHGLRQVAVLDLTDRESALAAITAADAIWISGGSQGLLMKCLREVDGAEEAIRQRYRSGATIGGTSAGAAVMSGVMIAGDDIPLDRGLALWPEAIIDQHFVVRKRMQRSFDAVLANPTLVGVGIDEGTAVIVSGGTFEVIGESTVTVIDARNAQRIQKGKTKPEGWRDVRIHSLREGMTWQIDSP